MLTGQIANELLKKELPLKIRLLGIRMSTLTDLTQKSADITKVRRWKRHELMRSSSALRARNEPARQASERQQEIWRDTARLQKSLIC